VIYFENLAD